MVADHITAEAILGMDFLEKNECILDLCKGNLTLKELEVVQLQPHCLKKLGTPVKVNLVETLTIPATAEIEVMAKLHSEGDTGVWMAENASTVPIMVARALVKPKCGIIPLRIINTSLTPVKVYNDSTIAQAELLD